MGPIPSRSGARPFSLQPPPAPYWACFGQFQTQINIFHHSLQHGGNEGLNAVCQLPAPSARGAGGSVLPGLLLTAGTLLALPNYIYGPGGCYTTGEVFYCRYLRRTLSVADAPCCPALLSRCHQPLPRISRADDGCSAPRLIPGAATLPAAPASFNSPLLVLFFCSLILTISNVISCSLTPRPEGRALGGARGGEKTAL